jgi:hypothetical protein
MYVAECSCKETRTILRCIKNAPLTHTIIHHMNAIDLYVHYCTLNLFVRQLGWIDFLVVNATFIMTFCSTRVTTITKGSFTNSSLLLCIVRADFKLIEFVKGTQTNFRVRLHGSLETAKSCEMHFFMHCV